ncbi:type II secretion system F family protein [Allobranchiibius sp. CTAmp26]|uniref:type II secretion system F family protein n=1 Tax=Allobranchiibius sp. CTAmp26 TaxID=2815214 RepID=UPI001AA17EC4|nr:type II secretion system F family protein [Allobranchiibius sp. CTAmp26]MBO1755500.1 type II secretion system F family protein [Allobranchiibius sp. CTAmp26]
MSPTVIVGIAACSLSLGLLCWVLLARPDPARQRAVSNLARGFTDAEGGVAEGFATSAAPLQASDLLRRLTPPGSIRRLERLLARAGRPPAWPMERLLGAKLLLGPITATLAVLYTSSNSGTLPVMIAIACTVVAYFLPELLLHSKGEERSKTIALELADTLDQMTIAVEAGLGFDSAMARAAGNGKGPLGQELVRTLQDIQVGMSRMEAYEALAERAAVPDLRKFIRAIIQADKYGVAIADVLRTQAAEMRMKRRQRAEEKAMQIPVKVIFPLMLCILPVLFIVLLGPAVMDIMKAFSH